MPRRDLGQPSTHVAIDRHVLGKDGQVSPPVEGVPVVQAAGQGGLLDVALSPDFAPSRLIFFS